MPPGITVMIMPSSSDDTALAAIVRLEIVLDAMRREVADTRVALTDRW